ncbi:hypothetical protein ABL78_2882 [Leptomonas seymouri]|uniref:Amastin-like surface protein-like protein n=1 Tax=Leptomonas seymouri TaxID=5684 RepID=A0A0N0P6T4_LEPSE|nr:hypothetical protein ABL78_2882 [Leptomonas seymouri]|eukprot:KPI88006.1 hypothetical protein ABL78_2882 [Leptomonas seymouri]
MKSYTSVRICVLIFSIVALVLAVVGVFMPFFTVSSSKQSTLDSIKANVLSSSFDPSKDAHMMQRFIELSSSSPPESVMTLWTLKYGGALNASAPVDLRDAYFMCYSGNMMIQTAEGMAVVTCVLGAANLILSAFTFAFSEVVKLPLALYFFLAAGAAAVTFCVMLHLYLNGWCDSVSMRSLYWDLTYGFALYVVSCTLYLTASILTMFID